MNQRAMSLKVGMVGAGFMGHAHSLAFDLAARRYPDVLAGVSLARIYDLDASAAQRIAAQYGWAEAVREWQAVTRGDADLVIIVTPNYAHSEIAIDAARHGKAVLCEKPLAASLAEAREMCAAVDGAQVVHQTGFVLRHWPAVRLAKKAISEGQIGELLTLRASYLQDEALDPSTPVGWRFQRRLAGGGSLADIGSHVIDLARCLGGDVRRVMARARTVWPERPDPLGRPAAVDVDDMTDLLVDFENGAAGVISCSWVAAGHKMDLRLEMSGTEGSIHLKWRQPDAVELVVKSSSGPATDRRLLMVGPHDEGADGMIPVAGAPMSLYDLYAAQARATVVNVLQGTSAAPSFLDGVRAAEVVEAAIRSSEEERWVDVPHDTGGASPGIEGPP